MAAPGSRRGNHDRRRKACESRSAAGTDFANHQGGVTVSIVVRNPDLVPELQRRAAHDLEAATLLRSTHR
jgi:hypothetical protein